jgi:hypothetical protein
MWRWYSGFQSSYLKERDKSKQAGEFPVPPFRMAFCGSSVIITPVQKLCNRSFGYRTG